MATIYFSGAISGGREDVDLYVEIVEHLRGQGHEVIAGEVVNREVTHEGEGLASSAIFERDLGWIRRAADERGLLVAEVSRPSLGVGYEVAVARYCYDIPVIALWSSRHSRRCSAMISGDPGIRLLEYGDGELPTLLERLGEAIREIAPDETGE